MEFYQISGGRPICGEYTVNGAKNAALPILAASLVTGGESMIYNCPQISDAEAMKEILTFLGCNVKEEDGGVMVDSRMLCTDQVPRTLMQKMRPSVFLVGPLLARCGRAVISQPGGCAIGARPIDIHIKALSQLGADVEEKDGQLIFTGPHMRGTNIILDFPSVGATENLMMAALGAKGETVIHNSAREPEIADLQGYLNACGADIKGAGTSRIVIKGRPDFHGNSYSIMGDRIEAGTFLMAAAATGGELLLDGLDTYTLKSLLKILRCAGCKVKREPETIWIRGPIRLHGAGKIRTGPYPGFSTDLQPQLAAVMAAAAGDTRIEETIFENRFQYTRQLIKMGADIEIFQRTAIIKGTVPLKGAQVTARDLRGGAALVLAGLMAEGETKVENVHYIERGYCGFHRALKKLGGEIDKLYEESE